MFSLVRLTVASNFPCVLYDTGSQSSCQDHPRVHAARQSTNAQAEKSDMSSESTGSGTPVREQMDLKVVDETDNNEKPKHCPKIRLGEDAITFKRRAHPGISFQTRYI